MHRETPQIRNPLELLLPSQSTFSAESPGTLHPTPISATAVLLGHTLCRAPQKTLAPDASPLQPPYQGALYTESPVTPACIDFSFS